MLEASGSSRSRDEAVTVETSTLERAKSDLVACGLDLYQRGLLTQTAGNLSIRVAEDELCITPSSLAYDVITPADTVRVNMEGTVLEGHRRPSSELPLHVLVYRTRSDVGAIVHTHSSFATTLAIMGLTIPAVHYMVASLGVMEVQVAEYATYGTGQLAENVRSAFPSPAKAVLIGNHGVVAVGHSLKEAATAAETVELLAGHYYRALTIGTPKVLSNEQMAEVMAKYQAAP